MQRPRSMATKRSPSRKKAGGGQKTPDVLELLASQHAEVDDLFDQLESAGEDRAAIFQELADRIAAHATAEEKVFYPAAMRDQTTEMLHQAVEEHLALKRVLADMLELDPEADEEGFMAKLAVAKEEFSHHAHEEEEKRLFPALRKLMSKDEREALAGEVLSAFEAAMEDEPRTHIPDETSMAASLPPP